MDRVIIYPGAVPLETDLLSAEKFAMIGLSKAIAALFGTASAIVNGLSVVPTIAASLNVWVNPGEIYSLQNIDTTAFSSLAADTTHQIVKQGILLDQATLSCPAPVTGGFSINYLIEAQYQDVDGTPIVLPYYNASNPATAYSGPANAGTTNNTTRKGTISLIAKAGAAAATGTQTTPAPDAGYTGLYVVTVANGQATITAPNISQYAAAPLLSAAGLIIGGLQGNYHSSSVAGGTADAITGSFTPNITALTNGMTLYVRAANANATATPTFTPNSGAVAAATIVKGNNLALVAGDIAGAGHWCEFQYDSTLTKWVLLNPSAGILGNAGRLINVQVFAAAGTSTYTPTVGTNSVVVEVQGGGASGGGAAATGATQSSAGTPGTSGSYGKGRFTSAFAGVTVTVGAGGVAGAAGASGNNGGSSSFGALLTAPGGNLGTFGVASTPPFAGFVVAAPAVATGGTIINVQGSQGVIALVLTASTASNSQGGSSVFGPGLTGNGVAAVSPGTGGPGAANTQSLAAAAGGAGKSGIVVVWEYA